VLQALFALYPDGNASSGADVAYIVAIIAGWGAAAISIALMFFVGVRQLRRGQRLQAAVNLVVSVFLLVVFVVPMILFYFSSPGVGLVN